MTRDRYVRLLNLAIERGEGPTFREHFPSPDNCPEDLYDNLFPGPTLTSVPEESPPAPAPTSRKFKKET